MPEKIPTIDEVKILFGHLFLEEGVKISEVDFTKETFDSEENLYELEATGPDPDPKNEGGKFELSYRRKVYEDNSKPTEVVIHSCYYDKSGIPIGGSSVAKFNGQEWRMTP